MVTVALCDPNDTDTCLADPIPAETMHRNAVSDVHSLCSHADEPTRAWILGTISLKHVPKIVTYVPPDVGPFDVAHIDAVGPDPISVV